MGENHLDKVGPENEGEPAMKATMTHSVKDTEGNEVGYFISEEAAKTFAKSENGETVEELKKPIEYDSNLRMKGGAEAKKIEDVIGVW